MKDDYFYEQLTLFLTSFLEVNEVLFETPKKLTENGVRVSVDFLLEQRVFHSKIEMKQYAILTYRIIIPEWCFEPLT